MARLCSDVIARVREILQDDLGVRYTDPQIFAHLNDAVQEARSIRPDLFVFKYGVEIAEVADPAEDFPLPQQYFSAVCLYIAGACELRDDEFASDGRASTLLGMLARKLATGA